MAKTKVAGKASGKKVSAVDQELMELFKQTGELAAKQTIIAESGTYIQIISDPESDILTPGKPTYIKGAKYKGFVIPSKSISLGASFSAVITGIFPVFEQYVFESDDPKDMGKIVGYWHPDDTLGFQKSGWFDRMFFDKNGKRNLLKQIYWVYFYLPDYPEIEEARLTMRGNVCKKAKELEKLVGKSLVRLSQAKFTVSTVVRKIEEYRTTAIDPDFTVDENIYDVKDGRVIPVDDVEVVKEVLTAELAVRKKYDEGSMIRRRDDATMIEGHSNANTRLITADDDDDDLTF